MVAVRQSTPRFSLGKLVATPAALAAVSPAEITRAIDRHHSGDWGDVCPEDHAANERALIEETRLFSVYHTSSGVKFWIITEADRSVTTCLLPGDY